MPPFVPGDQVQTPDPDQLKSCKTLIKLAAGLWPEPDLGRRQLHNLFEHRPRRAPASAAMTCNNEKFKFENKFFGLNCQYTFDFRYQNLP